MSSSTTSNPDSFLNPKQPIKPQNTSKSSIWGLLKWSLPILLVAIIIAFVVRQNTTAGHEQPAATTSVTTNAILQLPGTPRQDSLNQVSIQVGGCNPTPNIAELVTTPRGSQLEGSHDWNINGNPNFMNVVTGSLTQNNYGKTPDLEKLVPFVSFAALHDSREQDPDRRCHPGTRETVLKQLRDWFNHPNPTDRIIWLYGPAGAGKSTIAQTIAHEYNERGLAATFLFYRSDPERNDGNRLFPTIAWQLALSIPGLKDFIVYVLDKTPHLPRKDVETQFRQLVAHPLQALLKCTPNAQITFAPVVIIDGVDECSSDQLQQKILTVIGNAIKNGSLPFRFLICSRPEAVIEKIFDRFKDSARWIDLATLEDSHRDIEKYLVDQFSAIASEQDLDPTQWPGKEVIQDIVFQSSGNFILPSTLVKFISDEDNSPESQLDIVRKLKPRGRVSPFASLDELYLEILKRQPDQDFLKSFLALLVGRNSIEQDNLYRDDAILMNMSEKELHAKLRRMRSLLKLKPFIDVYHKSFLDFLQDSSRSDQYHVNKEGGLKQYLKLVVDSVIRHATEQSNHNETCFNPEFQWIIRSYHPKIVLPVEDWQETLQPLLDVQDKLLKVSMPQPCRVTQVMRDLLLHLALLQGGSHDIAGTYIPESNMNEVVTGCISAPVTGAMQNILETDLDSRLSVLLSCLQKTNSKMVVDEAIIGHMSSLLAFDCAETAARVWSISDAQKLIDLIVLLTNNESFLGQCGPDAARKAAHLASHIYARIPILPLSLFLNRPARHFYDLKLVKDTLEFICQSMLISKILDHNYILPVSGIYDEMDELQGTIGNVNEQSEAINKWLRRKSSPSFMTRIRVMLEIAKVIRYIHSMDIALYSFDIRSGYFYLDLNLHAKFIFRGLFAWWSREASIYGHQEYHFFRDCTYESNVSAFANLFAEVCFTNHTKKLSNGVVENARQLIERCRAKDPKSRPTMEDVVKEMETWNLS